jgi:hypothetical protein
MIFWGRYMYRPPGRYMYRPADGCMHPSEQPTRQAIEEST